MVPSALPPQTAALQCKPVVSFDGAHTKKDTAGVLLTSSTQDANRGLLTLGCALVESESTESWSWFIQCMKEGGLRDWLESPQMAVISDRDKGLMAAVQSKMPSAYHRWCLLHLYRNLCKAMGPRSKPHKGDFLELAKSPTSAIFWEKMGLLEKSHPGSAE